MTYNLCVALMLQAVAFCALAVAACTAVGFAIWWTVRGIAP